MGDFLSITMLEIYANPPPCELQFLCADPEEILPRVAVLNPWAVIPSANSIFKTIILQFIVVVKL